MIYSLHYLLKERTYMRKTIYFIIAILAFLAAEVLQLLLAGLLSAAYGIIIAMKGESTLDNHILYLISMVTILICGIVFFLWYYWMVRSESRKPWRSLLNSNRWVSLFGLGIGCQLLVSGGMSLIQSYFPRIFHNYSEVMEQLMSGSATMVALLSIIIAPIAEELIFRGVILHSASKAGSFLAANLLQGVLFGIYHWNLVQGIYAAALGFLLGYVCKKYQSILGSILLHMIINASAFFVVLFPDHMMGYLAMSMIGLILFTISMRSLLHRNGRVVKE